MPLTLQKLTSATVASSVDLKIPGQEETEKVALVYRPGVLSGTLEGELRRFGDSSEGWAALISKLIVSWDLEREPGEPYPIEYVPAKIEERDGKPVIVEPAGGALLELPTWILQGIVEGVKGDLRPNPKSAGTSGASS
jgi:hypothetical protein